MRRIICIGNRFTTSDSAGMVVFDRLKRLALPPDIEIVDGGLLGLNLLGFMEGAEHIVLVDAVHGFGQPGEVVVLETEEVLSVADDLYDHAGGLGYLLRALPHVLGSMPELVLVGIEGEYTEKSIKRAVEAALVLAKSSEQVSSMAMSREAS